MELTRMRVRVRVQRIVLGEELNYTWVEGIIDP